MCYCVEAVPTTTIAPSCPCLRALEAATLTLHSTSRAASYRRTRRPNVPKGCLLVGLPATSAPLLPQVARLASCRRFPRPFPADSQFLG